MTKEEFLASKDKCIVCGQKDPEFNLDASTAKNHYRLFFRIPDGMPSFWRMIFFHRECFAEIAGDEFTLDFVE